MSKDEKDKDTVDGVPKKQGRPVIFPETGPMTPMERYNRFKGDKVIIQLRITKETREKLNDICKKSSVSRNDLVAKWINEKHKHTSR